MTTTTIWWLYFDCSTYCLLARLILQRFVIARLGLQRTNIKYTPWPQSASELYRPSYRRSSAKLVPTFADEGCRVISATDPYDRILDFLALQLYSRGWVDPVPDPLLLGKSGRAGSRARDLWICSQELWPLDRRAGHSGLIYEYVLLYSTCRYERLKNSLINDTEHDIGKSLKGNTFWDVTPCSLVETKLVNFYQTILRLIGTVVRTYDPILAAVCLELEHALLGDAVMSAINRFGSTLNVRPSRRPQTLQYNDLTSILKAACSYLVVPWNTELTD
jgi:hypothetical protein